MFLNTDTQNSFTFHSLSESTRQKMISCKMWNENCPISLDRLRCVHFAYYDFNETRQEKGKIVVLDAVASRVVTIFQHLYDLRFPLAKAHPLEVYHGNDEASMAYNNSSAFNCRPITGGTALSLHSYGVAIDINPVQNPYLSFFTPSPSSSSIAEILPFQGKDFINRTNIRMGMVEGIVDVFKQNGFTIWGGEWNTPIDWQHFQPPRLVAQLLAAMTAQDAEILFELFIQHPNLLSICSAANPFLENRYHQNSQAFMAILKEKSEILDLDVEEAERTLRTLLS